MNARLLALLKIQPDEARLAGLVALFFGLVDLGRAIGDSTADALFLRRYGAEYLPYMYIGLGFLTFFCSLGYAAFVGRLRKERLFPAMLAGMALLLLAERLALPFVQRQLYPVLWLTINIIAALLGILVWNTAGEVCDTRQAKRLFPLFVTASILGGLVGSVLIGPVAAWLGTENLVFIYCLLLLGAALLVGGIGRRGFKPPEKTESAASFLADIQAGFQYVRRSPLLQLLGVSAVLFSVLFFSVSFPFNKIAAATYPDEARLAGFFGLFKGLSAALMFVAALLIANRLYARIGIVFALLLLPVTYFLGFLLFAVSYSMTSAVVVRLAQLVVLSGIGDGAYSTFFNVVPPERRAQVRAFDAGVPSQIGIILSGILTLLGERLLTNAMVFGMGMLVAALCGYVIWRMRPRYGEALAAALRAGRLDIFSGGEKIFAGIGGDSQAQQTLAAALSDPNPLSQQLAAELLGRSPAAGRAGAAALLARLPEASPQARPAFLQALVRLEAKEAASAAADCLADASAEVRAAALAALPALGGPAYAARLRPLLQDPDLSVRLQAAASLAECGETEAAAGALLRFLQDAQGENETARILRGFEPVLQAQAAPGAQAALKTALGYLQSPAPALRRAACRGLAHTPLAFPALAQRLADPAPEVRAEAARALQSAGPAAAPYALAQISSAPEAGVVLAALPAGDPALAAPLRLYARAELEKLKALRQARRAFTPAGPASACLAALLEDRAGLAEQRLVQVIGLIGDPAVMRLAAQALGKAAGPEQRATAVEALDTLGDRQLVKDLLPLLEDTASGASGSQPAPLEAAAALRRLAGSGEALLQALAGRSAGELGLDGLAQELMPSGGAMDTLQTLSIVERTLLLRAIPLFAGLSTDDLVQVAQSASERWFDDGVPLCRQGELGEELFVIASGKVQVSKLEAGQAHNLAVRQAGEFIGEMAIIESAPRIASVTAAGEVRALVITAAAFKAILQERPPVAMAVMRSLSHRLRELS